MQLGDLLPQVSDIISFTSSVSEIKNWTFYKIIRYLDI